MDVAAGKFRPVKLIQVMDKLELRISRAPTIQRKRKSSKKSKRRVGENDRGESPDPIPILQSFLTGYFTNVANKSPHRAVFSHYAPDH